MDAKLHGVGNQVCMHPAVLTLQSSSFPFSVPAPPCRRLGQPGPAGDPQHQPHFRAGRRPPPVQRDLPCRAHWTTRWAPLAPACGHGVTGRASGRPAVPASACMHALRSVPCTSCDGDTSHVASKTGSGPAPTALPALQDCGACVAQLVRQGAGGGSLAVRCAWQRGRWTLNVLALQALTQAWGPVLRVATPQSPPTRPVPSLRRAPGRARPQG